MKRQVFSCFFKLQTEASVFILSGKQFHSVAAAYLKDLFPYVTVLTCGTTSSDLDEDLSVLLGLCFSTSSQIYSGAESCKAL